MSGVADHMTTDEIKLAWRLRARGLTLPVDAWRDERIEEIAVRQKQLAEEHAELDQKLKRLMRGEQE